MVTVDWSMSHMEHLCSVSPNCLISVYNFYCYVLKSQGVSIETDSLGLCYQRSKRYADLVRKVDRLSWNSKVFYRVHKRSQLFSVLSQSNRIQYV